MHRPHPTVILLVVLCAALSTPPAAAGYRFHALLDTDRDATTGCVVQTAAGSLPGSEMRVVAETNRTRVLGVVHENCRDGVWQEVARHTPDRQLALGSGPNGGDLIHWSLPAESLLDHSAIDVRLVAEHAESGAADLLAGTPMSLDWSASAMSEAHPIPGGSPVGLGVLVLAMMVLAALRLRRPVRPLAVVLFGVAVLIMSFHGPIALSAQAGDVVAGHDKENDARSGSSRAVDPKPGQSNTVATLADAAHDQTGTDAGVDLLHAQVKVDASGMQFEVEVRDIEFEALADGARVLLLGNSLTYSNRLPEMLQAIARQAGRSLITESVTQGGANLDDLYHRGDALREIASGRYQRVIMQQGPSSLPASQEDLRLGALQFNAPIRASGARPALYMVWPDITRRAFFDDVRASYSNAALAVDGMFIPAGEAWRAAWRIKPSLRLYDSDQFHPSELGSYAAALSMFAELYGQTPIGLPANLTLASGRTLRFDPADALIVQQAAWEAHLQYGRAGR